MANTQHNKESQTKSFVKWINVTIKLANPSSTSKVSVLTEDFKDGIMLAQLCEALSGKSIGKINTKKPNMMQARENLSKCFDFLKKEKVPLENVGAVDIVEGNETIIGGLIWSLILFYQIKKGNSEGGVLSPTKGGTTVRQDLLDWWRRALDGVEGAEVKNLTSSFQDGTLFLSLLAVCGRFNMKDIKRDNKIENLRTAFSLLRSEFGVPDILDAEDAVTELDDKSMMAYTALIRENLQRNGIVFDGTKPVIKPPPPRKESMSELFEPVINKVKQIDKHALIDAATSLTQTQQMSLPSTNPSPTPEQDTQAQLQLSGVVSSETHIPDVITSFEVHETLEGLVHGKQSLLSCSQDISKWAVAPPTSDTNTNEQKKQLTELSTLTESTIRDCHVLAQQLQINENKIDKQQLENLYDHLTSNVAEFLKTCQRLTMADVKTEGDSTLLTANQSDIEKTYSEILSTMRVLEIKKRDGEKKERAKIATELHNLSGQLLQLKQQISQDEVNLGEKDTQVIQLKQNVGKLENEVSTLQQNLTNENKSLKSTKESLTQTTGRVNSLEKELASLQNENKKLQTDINKTQEQTKQQQTQVAEEMKKAAQLKQQISDKEKRISELQQEIDNSPASTARAVIEILTNQNKELQGQLQGIFTDYGKLNSQFSELSLKIPLYLQGPRVTKVPPPTGSVTLVFTDVQGSTAQWDFHPPVMAKVIHKHNELMRKLIDKHNGYEVKTEGDAFMVAFSTTDDALRWCLDVQQELLKVDWPSDAYNHKDSKEEQDTKGRLIWRGARVRMGIHTGEPSCETDPTTGRMDYFGPMVNRSARVSGMSQGGQILMSSQVYKNLEKQIPNFGKLVVNNLGEFQLKGLSEPTLIYSVIEESLSGRKFEVASKKENKEDQEKLSLQAQIEALQKKNESLATQLKEVESKVSENAKKADALVTAMNNSNSNSDTDNGMSSVLEEYKQMTEQAKQELHHLKFQNKELEVQIENLKVAADPSARIKTEEELAKTLKDRDQLKVKYETLVSEQGKQTSEFNLTKEKLTQSETERKKERDQFEATKQAWTQNSSQDKQTLQTNITNLENTLKKERTQNESSLSHAENERKKLQDQLQSNITQLENALKKERSQNEHAEKERKRLAEEKDANTLVLNSQKKQFEENNRQLQSKIDELTSEQEKKEQQLSIIRSELSLYTGSFVRRSLPLWLLLLGLGGGFVLGRVLRK